MKAEPGDLVKVTTTERTIEGILIPTPDLTGGDTVIIKLKNGYNAGIGRKKIKKIQILEKYRKPAEKKDAIRQKPGLPTVSILSTGGTISSKVDYRTGGVYADYTAEDFLRMCPELSDMANIRAKKVLSLMSEDMLPSDWIKIAEIVKEEIEDGVDGIVITHGTDTMHFTSAALSFMLGEINIPVIITGSQRSIDRGSSDAFMNLICSVKAAAESDIAEVMICMHGSINDDYGLLLRGTKVRKMHTSRRDAFRPINAVPLAKVNAAAIDVLAKDYRKADRTKRSMIRSEIRFDEHVVLHYVYPGMDPGVLDYYIRKGARGIVIGATALGHVNTWTDKSLLPQIKKAIKKGIAVFITTQTLYGRVNPFVYTNLRKLSIEAGAVYLEDMLPEVAYVKLGWVLGQAKDAQEAKEMMIKDYRGELCEQLTPEMFLN